MPSSKQTLLIVIIGSVVVTLAVAIAVSRKDVSAMTFTSEQTDLESLLDDTAEPTGPSIELDSDLGSLGDDAASISGPTQLQAIGKRIKSLYNQYKLAKDIINFSVEVLQLKEPLVNRLRRRLKSLTVYKFIDRCVRGHELNPVIVDMSKKVSVEYILNYTLTRKKKTDIRRAVGFCVLLQALTPIIYNERNTYTRLYDHLSELRNNTVLLPYLGTFEAAKMFTLDAGAAGWVSESVHTPGPNNDAYAMQLNILEAMLQDRVVRENYANADAGGVLYQNGCDQEENPMTGQKPNEVSPLGHSQYFFPFGEDWVNIYIGWNMDFVMGEGNLTMISKLSFPMITENYHRGDNVKNWVQIRALSLWVMIQHEALWRARIRNNKVMRYDWANPSIYLPCGDAVLEHANAYDNRVVDAVSLGSWESQTRFNLIRTSLWTIEETFEVAFRLLNLFTDAAVDMTKLEDYRNLILVTQRSLSRIIQMIF